MELRTESKKESQLAIYKARLDAVFSVENFRDSHIAARSILGDMAASDETLFSIISQNINDPEFMQSKRINPVLALPIFETSAYTLVANCWIPRPDGDTSISHQSIHHHGNLLLTSVAAFGPGYESFLFKKGYSVGETVDLCLEEAFQHTRGNIEFVDTQTPHLVFYPSALSITYALWSKEAPRKIAELDPKLKLLKPALRKISLTLGLGAILGLNQEENLDFYVEAGSFRCLKRRIKYSAGSRENFLGALRYLLEHTGYSRDSVGSANEFEADHLLIPRVNLRRAEVLACLR